MAFEITGKIIDISPVIQVSDKFKNASLSLKKKKPAEQRFL
jgi:hypothetical protein